MTDPLDLLRFEIPTLGGKQLWADGFVFGGYRIQEHAVNGRNRLLGPRNERIAGGSWERCLEVFHQIRAERKVQLVSDHLVLMLHGIFRAKEAFNPMRRALREAGYEAEALNYPSTQATIESHADQVQRVLERSEGVRTVSLVTHSMGGLVARELLSRPGGWRDRIAFNRLVMIATPNRGAVMADHLLPLWAFRRLAGPAAVQLTPEYVAGLAIPDEKFGIVAGARGDHRGYNPLLPGDDDMTVALQSTRLDGAEDTLVVNAIHTFIMQHPEVIAGTLRYLRTGRFTDQGS